MPNEIKIAEMRLIALLTTKMAQALAPVIEGLRKPENEDAAKAFAQKVEEMCNPSLESE